MTTPKPPAPSPLEQTARGPLVLLFYDGYERRASPGLIGGLRSQLRRVARFAYRSARRRQVRTGFYTAFLSLVNCLRQAGCDVRINDFGAAEARPTYPIGLAGYPSVLDRVKLPNPVIFGPGSYGSPEDSVAVAAQARIRRLIQPCDWYVDYYRPYCGEKMMAWFAGIDLKDWPDVSGEPKSIDCLIYDKIRWNRDTRVPEVLERAQQALDRRGLSWHCVRYGHHHQKTFREELRKARSLMFLCEHETQGLAYQEAMAAGIPVLAWDEGQLVDPWERTFAKPGLAVTSVPYFDARCGMRFKLDEMEPVMDQFFQRIDSFDPRAYVRDRLSMQQAASAYLAAYGALAAGKF